MDIFKNLTFLKPLPLPFSYEEWKSKPYHERVKMLCVSWATQGYGAPASVYVFYALKIMLYISMWLFFCSFNASLGTVGDISTWIFEIEALQIAILWSIVFEILGFGCGSGPLTARYMPPFGAFLHFLRVGTIKMPFFQNIPLLNSDKRNFLDVFLYLGFLFYAFKALVSPEITIDLILPIVILLPILGILDKTIFLAARSEHYLIALICFLFPYDTISGLKIVWLAIWWGAASSKLNLHFPTVVGVMISNHAVLRFPFLRKKMYVNYPTDLRPSQFSKILAHLGTATEYFFPLLLIFGGGNEITMIGLFLMLGFHIYITSSVPMGVPLEWNFLMVYGAFLLFGHEAETWIFSVQHNYLITILTFSLLVLPILGNLFPKWISFLVSMRYYAGNWAYSVWLFKENGAEEKMDKHLKKANLTLDKQLSMFYKKEEYETLAAKVIAFRHSHLHGRALHDLIPKAVDNIEEYVYRDGEIIAGIALGWNFGDGHLHNEQLLKAIQKRCNYEAGELRCIFVESQPLFKPYMEWQIFDAKEGLLEKGKVNVKDLTKRQPWPTQ
jgi:hypothetical protein